MTALRASLFLLTSESFLCCLFLEVTTFVCCFVELLAFGSASACSFGSMHCTSISEHS